MKFYFTHPKTNEVIEFKAKSYVDVLRDFRFYIEENFEFYNKGCFLYYKTVNEWSDQIANKRKKK